MLNSTEADKWQWKISEIDFTNEMRSLLTWGKQNNVSGEKRKTRRISRKPHEMMMRVNRDYTIFPVKATCPPISWSNNVSLENWKNCTTAQSVAWSMQRVWFNIHGNFFFADVVSNNEFCKFPWTRRVTCKQRVKSQITCSSREMWRTDDSQQCYWVLCIERERAFPAISIESRCHFKFHSFSPRWRADAALEQDATQNTTQQERTRTKGKASSSEHFSKNRQLLIQFRHLTTFRHTHTLRLAAIHSSWELKNVDVVDLKITTLRPEMEWTIQSAWMNYLTWLQSFFCLLCGAIRSNVIAIWYVREMECMAAVCFCWLVWWRYTTSCWWRRFGHDWKFFQFFFLCCHNNVVFFLRNEISQSLLTWNEKSQVLDLLTCKKNMKKIVFSQL